MVALLNSQSLKVILSSFQMMCINHIFISICLKFHFNIDSIGICRTNETVKNEPHQNGRMEYITYEHLFFSTVN